MARCVSPVTVINRFTSVTVQMLCLLHGPPLYLKSPLYTDGSVPRDGPYPIPVPYPLWSVVIVSVVTGIGMVCALICLVVTVAYRKHR